MKDQPGNGLNGRYITWKDFFVIILPIVFGSVGLALPLVISSVKAEGISEREYAAIVGDIKELKQTMKEIRELTYKRFLIEQRRDSRPNPIRPE